MTVSATYKDYRESGISWLEKIPSHWSVTKFKRYCDIQLGKMLQPQPNAPTDIQVPYLRAMHVQWERVDVSELPEMWASEREIKKFRVKSGDLLVCEGGEAGRTAILENVEGDCIIQNALHRIRGNENTFTPYINYLMRHIADAKWFEILCNKATIAHLTGEKLGELGLPLPSHEEQQSIVRFLDFKTAQIDALIAKKQTLLDKLAEKRTALISHAVTKGLDPSVPMKDSGVAWLGEIPAHWVCPPLYTRFRIELGKMLDESRITGKYLVPYLRNIDVQWDEINTQELPVMDIRPNEYSRYLVQAGDLLVCEGGDVGRAAIVGNEPGRLGYQKALHRMRAIDLGKESSRFLFFTLNWASQIGLFLADGNPNTIPHLTGEKLRRYRFPCPPFDEQKSIADWLDSQCSNIGRQQKMVSKVIERLQEYRSALITNAVTGKIDVRDFVVPANAGTQDALKPGAILDSRLRGNDVRKSRIKDRGYGNDGLLMELAHA